jgi:hypothetical protein
MFIATPQFNGVGRKEFATMKEAVKYLEETTGYEMNFDYPKGVKKVFENRVYDWELIGKLERATV